MPPRWPREPDRANDPAFRRLEDRINFAVHVALFAASNSGVWFFNIFQQAEWPWATWMTLLWLGVLMGHLVYISAIAQYNE